MNIQKLFKPYFVRRKNGQCQVLIPLVELDGLCDEIELLFHSEEKMTIERLKGFQKGLSRGMAGEQKRIIDCKICGCLLSNNGVCQPCYGKEVL